MSEISRDQERWLPVVGVEGYSVSNQGRVRSDPRVVYRGNTPVRLSGRVLKTNPDKKGYLYVHTYRHGRRVTACTYVHIMVLASFVGPRPVGMDACHGPGGTQDNRLINLRWDTRLENNRDILRHGTHNNVNKSACPRGHLLVESNLVRAHVGRTCLACQRARSRCRYYKLKGQPLNFVEVANEYYKQIMSAES